MGDDVVGSGWVRDQDILGPTKGEKRETVNKIAREEIRDLRSRSDRGR